jgi:hypothetical protein
VAVIIRITPDLLSSMCGATAFAVRNYVLVAIAIGRAKSSSDISLATASSFARVRPATKTFAPSRAKARATAPPIAPPAR